MLVGAIFVGSLAVANPAGATMFEKVTPYAGEDSAAFPFCGIDVDWPAEFSGKVLIREGKGKQAGAFFVHDRFSAVEMFTNPANGKFFMISHDGLFHEVRATHVEGSVFEFVAHEVGQPFVVRDMEGIVVVRDRGATTTTFLFDTEGDDVPGGIFLEEVGVRVSGPHPAFFFTEEEVCEAVVGMIG